MTAVPIETFRAEARTWLEQTVRRRPEAHGPPPWDEGSDSVALFRNLSAQEEKAHIDAYRAWVQQKADAGFANLSWDPEWGGRGLPSPYEWAFAEEEAHFETPASHEAVGITRELIAPTIRAEGTDDQRRRFLRRMLRTDDLWCQMFSEPGAGSDLAGLVTSAVRDGDEWVLNGQKVWTSGAQFADWGYILCRTDPSLPKHRGLTAFIVSMSAPGLEVRPLRQMTGGSSFNEVFFNDVRVPDGDRLGAPGHGWRVALTTLGFERTATGVPGGMRTVGLLMTLARRLCRDEDPVVRELLACAYCRQRISDLSDERAKAALRSGETPGPEGSIGKLYRSETLRAINEAASVILGPRLLADTGEWGTYTWTEHLLGTAGARIAGGSDEIQRNILGERLLGLPGEPRVDRDVPFRDVPH